MNAMTMILKISINCNDLCDVLHLQKLFNTEVKANAIARRKRVKGECSEKGMEGNKKTKEAQTNDSVDM